MSDEWACVQTRPAEESRAKTWIENDGHQTYLPLMRERHDLIKPLFPRYLFVVISERWRHLCCLPGVSSILMSGEKPAILRITDRRLRRRGRISLRIYTGDEVIERIRAMAGADGIIDSPRESRYFREPYDRGQVLRVKDIWHVLHGRDLIFCGMRSSDRVRVMLSWFGREQVLDLQAGLVEAVQ